MKNEIKLSQDIAAWWHKEYLYCMFRCEETGSAFHLRVASISQRHAAANAREAREMLLTLISLGER